MTLTGAAKSLFLLGAATGLWIGAVIAAAAASAVISLCVALKYGRKKSGESVERIKESLKSISCGHYHPVRADSSNPELYAVMNEINEIADAFSKNMRLTDAERRKLTFVMDHISQCILAVDCNNVIKIMNKSAQKLFARDESFIGRDMYFAVGDAKFLSELASALKSGPDSFEYRMGDKYLSVHICRTESGAYDEITDIIIITDISAEKLAAKQRSDFFSNAGHELKTPLTSIQGLTELLLVKIVEDSPAYKYAQRINKEAARLSALVLDMLKLSNIENLQSLPASEESVSSQVALEEIAADAIASLEAEAARKNLTVSLTGSGKVNADPKKICEIVNNLYSNAVNYNKQDGSVSINISDLPDKVIFTVSDTGIGIDKKHIPRLCERFYRVDKSRSKKTGGTGLGLAIVKHVCALYEAELNIESEENEGTTVSVTFRK